MLQGIGAGTLQSAGAASGSGPTQRNALMTWLVPGIVLFGGVVVGLILSTLLAMISPALAILGTLVLLGGYFAGLVLYVLSAIKMIGELNTVTRNTAFPWWPILVPGYNVYWLWILVPAEVAKAKQMMGAQTPPRGIALYIFLWHYALALDLNDLVR